VILYFGLIARGKQREIERLQDFIERNLPNFRVIYQTVTARKLKLLKIRGISGMNGRVEKYKRKLEEHERKVEERLSAIRIDDLLSSSQQLKTVPVEGLGVIEYGRLTVEDILAINSIKDPTERSIEAITRMLRKADSEVTAEKIKMLPADLFAKIVSALAKEITQNFR